jgi:D-glycero-D-manno-heptose 1,7-bisphosphate phosphatase
VAKWVCDVGRREETRAVLNIDGGYVHRREDFRFQDGIFELCRVAQELGYLRVVVTNEAGIARGYFTETEFDELTRWMKEQFRRQNVRIARVYYCPYHPTEGIGSYRRDSPERKPGPGMLYRAQAELGVDLASSVLIGDKQSDMEAARTAGVGTRILLLATNVSEIALGTANARSHDPWMTSGRNSFHLAP